MIPWEFRGREVTNCNCDPGCPCQFNSMPTNGSCHAVAAVQIDSGRFGDTRLDGLRFAAIMWWPGPIHEMHGKCQPIVDVRADENQREALLTILSGGETEPGATVFNVFATTMEEVFDPVFADIEVSADVEGRKGRIKVAGLIDTVCQPILNPVTGDEHRARINLPQGFEYSVAEVGRGSTTTGGPIAFEIADTHSHFVAMHMTNQGVVRA